MFNSFRDFMSKSFYIFQDGMLTPNEVDAHFFLFASSKATNSGRMLHDEFQLDLDLMKK